ncbi:MAG: hypothetical protein HZA31_09460 [Opitutae bacterium]|nr:hypothetical protein [Opitutae bacterium]
MKNITTLVLLLGVAISQAFGRHGPIEVTLKSADAIAHVRVISVCEDLKGALVTRRATLSIVGKSHGLKDAMPLEVPFGRPSKVGSYSFSFDSPIFHIGQVCIVIMRFDGDQPCVLRQIYLSDDGKIEEPKVFRSVGFDCGAEADFAVDCLVAAMKKKLNQ